MKATIERATLLRCLSHVQSVVERRNTIPILSNVLIDADTGGGVKVMATDLDLQVVETMTAASVESGGHARSSKCASESYRAPKPTSRMLAAAVGAEVPCDARLLSPR